jgi:glycine/D-amino acid oxidase-like deaminating enzyme
MHLIEPVFAFYDDDFALATVLKRQAWPQRPGRTWGMAVRKLSVTAADRNTYMWDKVENDSDYRALMREVWLRDLAPSDDDPPPAKRQQNAMEQIERAAKAVHTLQAHGVKVLFVRSPSTGPYLEADNRMYPRKTTWDVLLARSGAPGIHFEDYPELQGLEQPEWSHLSHAAAVEYTASLYHIIERDFWGPTAAARRDQAKSAP